MARLMDKGHPEVVSLTNPSKRSTECVDHEIRLHERIKGTNM